MPSDPELTAEPAEETAAGDSVVAGTDAAGTDISARQAVPLSRKATGSAVGPW